MLDAATQTDLLKEVERLPLPLQQKVINYARSLGESTPCGTPGKQLLKYAGFLSPEEAKAMMDAIEEGCERIEPNEW
jgi:hypothetical protein